jgi:membrane-associated protein
MDLHGFLVSHPLLAPALISLLILLAGLSIPISIDVLLIVTVILASTVYTSHILSLFFLFTISCIVSAWIAYSMGRFLGRRLIQLRFFSRFINEQKIEKIEAFCQKYGPLTYILVRFVPFGVRSCLFLSSGFSKVPFWRFAFFDAIGCFLWSGLVFFGCYSLGNNYESLLNHIKILNICLFLAFSVTVIASICYKLGKRKKTL